MKLLHRLDAEPDRPATLADVRAAYARNRRRFLLLAAFSLVLTLSFAGYSVQQQHNQRVVIHRQCEARKVAVIKANAFYAQLAVIEQHNPFIDDAVRNQRIQAYAAQVYAVPRC